MGKVIDINIHHTHEDFFTDQEVRDGFLSTAPTAQGWKAEIIELPPNAEGKVFESMKLEHPIGKPILDYVDGDYSAESKITAMDNAGVDYGILRVPVWQEWLRVETCKKVNDNAQKIIAESNGRIFATACIPPWDFKDNYYELERCVDMGAVGVQLACHYGQLYLDDPVFRPMLRKIEQLGLPVVVHHTPHPPFPESIVDYTLLRREYGRIIDQGTAVGRELLSDLFEELPGLKFIHTMFGGNWYAQQNLVFPHAPKAGTEKMDRLKASGSEKPLTGEEMQKRLDNNIFYDMTHPHSWGKAQVEAAIKVSGADHYFFGSSFPVFLGWMKAGVDFVNNTLEITDEERENILFNNAKKMFNLPV